MAGSRTQTLVRVKLDWQDKGDIPLLACNAFLLQQTPHEFVLSFGAVLPPILEKPEDIRKIKQLPAKTVARISLAPGRLVELLGAIQQALNAYQQQTQKR